MHATCRFTSSPTKRGPSPGPQARSRSTERPAPGDAAGGLLLRAGPKAVSARPGDAEPRTAAQGVAPLAVHELRAGLAATTGRADVFEWRLKAAEERLSSQVG